MLYVDDLFLMSVKIEVFFNEFRKCDESFDSKGLNIIVLGRPK